MSEKGPEKGVETLDETKLRRPRLYKVMLHNDDYSTMEFVTGILEKIFSLSGAEATRVMLKVHKNGVGVAGIFSREIAEMKMAEVTTASAKYEQPLQCSMEPE